MKKILFLSLISSQIWIARGDTIYPWSSPDWGFIRPHSQDIPKIQTNRLKNSLIFDQPSDSKTLASVKPTASIEKPVIVANTFKQLGTTPKAPASPPEIKVAEIVQKKPIVEVSTKIETPELKHGVVIDSPWTRPATEKTHLRIVDDESLSLGQPRALSGVEVYWLGLESGLKTYSNQNGIALAPKSISHSARFIAKAPGYIPAVGYAIGEMITPVVMFKESRITGVAQSVLKPITEKVQAFPYPNAISVFGKIIDRNGKPQKGIWIDTSVEQNHQVFYSLGSLGLFLPAQKTTGDLGEFLISGMGFGYKPFLATQVGNTNSDNSTLEPVESATEAKNWPSYFVDFSGLTGFATTTLQEGRGFEAQTQLLEQNSQSFPEGQQIIVNLGGEISRPSSDGVLDFKTPISRPAVEFVEITNPSFFKTVLNISSNLLSIPDQVLLFSERDLYSVFQDVALEINLERPLIVGNLRPENDEPFIVEVMDYRGKHLKEVPVFYFDDSDGVAFISRELKHSDGFSQSFVVGNLIPGEYHLRLRNARNQKVFATQVVRTKNKAVTLTQF